MEGIFHDGSLGGGGVLVREEFLVGFLVWDPIASKKL